MVAFERVEMRCEGRGVIVIGGARAAGRRDLRVRKRRIFSYFLLLFSCI